MPARVRVPQTIANAEMIATALVVAAGVALDRGEFNLAADRLGLAADFRSAWGFRTDLVHVLRLKAHEARMRAKRVA
jgi:hypothetical protein